MTAGSAPPPPASASTGRGALALLRRQWFPAAIVLVTAVFIAQNRETVSIDVLFLSVRAPLWIVLIVVFLLGAALGALVRRRRARAAARSRG